MSTTPWDEFLHGNVDDVATRPAHRLPKVGDGISAPTHLVHLHHPGYLDANQSILFTIPTCSINNDKKPCAEYWLAWQGCYVLAIERRGFFTARPQRNSIKVAHGQGLVAGHYWYHLDTEDEQEPYATLQSFRSWRYSPESMPVNWSHAIPWDGKQDDDQREGDCCVTGEDFTQRAHLIPKTEWEWWIENGMSDHAGTSGVTRATSTIGQEMLVPENLVPLSDGLHRMWDNDFFCLFPLKTSDGQWRLHCLFMLPLQKMVRIHHRRPVRGGLADVSAACAWARFVFSVCRKYETTFLAKRARRKLGGSTTTAQWMEAEQILQQRQDWIRNTSPTKKSRSGSPRKRDRSESRGDRADSAVWDDFETDEKLEAQYAADEDSADAGTVDECLERGRLRSREDDQNRKEKCWRSVDDGAKRRKIVVP
ncbi:hypothetical protein Q7P37_006676 [Cladosporium fusiforme]